MKWFAALLLLASSPGLATEDEPMRVRLTETSITETGRLTRFETEKLQTKGYGFTVIHPTGVGGSYTELTTRGDDVVLRHHYLDLNYTYGDRFLITGGAGHGIGGSAAVNSSGKTLSTSWTSANSLSLGPGFSIGWFEVYWIHRRNWVKYQVDGEPAVLASRHYQLGLGAHF